MLLIDISLVFCINNDVTDVGSNVGHQICNLFCLHMRMIYPIYIELANRGI
jgi:hypothetical protein